MARYVFDIDGTICSLTEGDYQKASPYEKRIKLINELFDNNNEIIFYTARGMGSSNNNQYVAINKWFTFTEMQLKSWGVKYHCLILGKPSGDHYIDDKGIKDEHFFGNDNCK